MKSTIAALSCILIGMVTAQPIDNNGKVHEVMTNEELKHVFNAQSNANVPDYEVVSIKWPKFHKRSYGSAIEIPLAAFGRNVTLWLHPTDGILGGYDTPVYTIESDSNYPEGYVIKTNDDEVEVFGGQQFEDRAEGASIIVKRSASGRTTITGNVESEGWVVRPLPSRFTSNITNGYRGSLDDVDNLKNNTTAVDHVIYKSREGKNQETLDHSSMNMTDDSISGRVSRSTRRVPSIVYPQLCVVVDYETYKIHGENKIKLLEYLLIFWNSVDLRFRSFENPRVRLNLASILIALDSDALSFISSNIIDANERTAVDASDVSREFGIFLYKAQPHIRLDSYDIAVAMTSYEMCLSVKGKCSRKILGRAKKAGACLSSYTRIYSAAVIHDKGGYDGIRTATHELGHLFGVDHDNGTTGECSAKEGYIMASNNSRTINAADWSPCSLSQFETFFQKDYSICLDNKPKTTSSMPIDLPGRLLTADQQCQRTWGGNACTIDEDICRALRCRKKNGSGCWSSVGAADGTPCGDKKICLKNKCWSEDQLQ